MTHYFATERYELKQKKGRGLSQFIDKQKIQKRQHVNATNTQRLQTDLLVTTAIRLEWVAG